GQSRTRDTEHPGGRRAIAVGQPERDLNGFALHRGERLARSRNAYLPDGVRGRAGAPPLDEQVLRLDRPLVAAENRRALDDVAQLPYVARPTVCVQRLERRRRKHLDTAVLTHRLRE